MKAEMKLFNFNSNQIRVFVNEKNEPEFCATDVTKILGYTNGRDAIAKHCKSDGVAKRDTIDSLGRTQPTTFISESNLYRLILKSENKEAEPFENFVCDEVLPSIRKHGAYMTAEVVERMLTDPDTIIKLATDLKLERAEKERLQVTTELQQKELKEAAPKVEYFENVLQSESLILSNVIAKELGMSAVSLNKLLHQLGVIYKSGETWVLYQKYQDKGYTGTKTATFTDSFGVERTQVHMYWTEKGRKFIHDVIKEYFKNKGYGKFNNVA